MDNDRDLLLISIFTFITVSLWIAFELLKTAKATTLSTVTQQIVVPLSPKIDTDTLILINDSKIY